MKTAKKSKKITVIICAIAVPVIALFIVLLLLPGESLLIPVNEQIIFLDHPPRLSDVLPYMQDGDFILRMAPGAWSMSFREYSPVDKRFSHSGIVRMRDKSITIVHALGSFSNPDLGVEEIPLDRFLQVASSIGIFRVKGGDGAVISDTAMQYIGCSFDFDFDYQDDSKVYCTELLYLTLKPLNLEHILPTIYVDDIKKYAIPIDSISNNPAIDELVYIVDQREHPLDEVNQLVFSRHNPVKNTFIQKMLALARIFVSPRQNK